MTTCQAKASMCHFIPPDWQIQPVNPSASNGRRDTAAVKAVLVVAALLGTCLLRISATSSCVRQKPDTRRVFCSVTRPTSQLVGVEDSALAGQKMFPGGKGGEGGLG